MVVLSDAWLAGAVASKKDCILEPKDIEGQKIRSAGPTFAAMWQKAGASIVSVPSNEVYNALQTGVADATDTSTGSFVSFRIYEQVKCITAPGRQRAVVHVRAGADVQEELRRASTRSSSRRCSTPARRRRRSSPSTPRASTRRWSRTFKSHGVKVVEMTPAQYDAWVKVARESSYEEFAKEVPDGKQLIDEALSVK